MIAPDFGWDYPPGTTTSDLLRELGGLPYDCASCGRIVTTDDECESDQCWDDAAPFHVDHCNQCCHRHEQETAA